MQCVCDSRMYSIISATYHEQDNTATAHCLSLCKTALTCMGAIAHSRITISHGTWMHLSVKGVGTTGDNRPLLPLYLKVLKTGKQTVLWTLRFCMATSALNRSNHFGWLNNIYDIQYNGAHMLMLCWCLTAIPLAITSPTAAVGTCLLAVHNASCKL